MNGVAMEKHLTDLESELQVMKVKPFILFTHIRLIEQI